MRLSAKTRGIKLIEVMFTTTLIGVFGLIIYSMLTTGTILGAKNTAVNTAHQQARTAMLQMMQDLHSSVSMPRLINVDGTAWPSPTPNVTPSPAPGIAFQLWAAGPYRVLADAAAGQSVVRIASGAGLQVGQRVAFPFYDIEGTVSAYNATTGNITMSEIWTYNETTKQNTMTQTLPVTIKGPVGSAYAVCYISDRCSYTVVQGALQWQGPTATSRNALAKLGSSITTSNPFNMPLSATGTPDFLAVTAIDLSTSDANYSKRGFKSANILLNGKVPIRARLTAYQ